MDLILLPDINEWKNKIDVICLRFNNLSYGNNVCLDMSKIKFLRPQGAIMLILICDRIKELTGNQVELKGIDKAVHAYLERINFFQIPHSFTYEKLSPWLRFNRNAESLTVMELTHVKSPLDSVNIGTKVENILDTWFPDRNDKKFSSVVATMVKEICNNSLEHSKGYIKMGECYCMLQKYSIGNKPEIAIAIGDIGVGIKHNIKNIHKGVLDSDVVSIKKVLAGLSGREDGSGGMGIPFIKTNISKYKGSFAIRSGKGIVEVQNSIKASEFQNSFPGTQTILRLN